MAQGFEQSNTSRLAWEQRNLEIQEAQLRAMQTLNTNLEDLQRKVPGFPLTPRHRVSSAEPSRFHDVTQEDMEMREGGEDDTQEEAKGSGDGDEENIAPTEEEPRD